MGTKGIGETRENFCGRENFFGKIFFRSQKFIFKFPDAEFFLKIFYAKPGTLEKFYRILRKNF